MDNILKILLAVVAFAIIVGVHLGFIWVCVKLYRRFKWKFVAVLTALILFWILWEVQRGKEREERHKARIEAYQKNCLNEDSVKVMIVGKTWTYAHTITEDSFSKHWFKITFKDRHNLLFYEASPADGKWGEPKVRLSLFGWNKAKCRTCVIDGIPCASGRR